MSGGFCTRCHAENLDEDDYAAGGKSEPDGHPLPAGVTSAPAPEPCAIQGHQHETAQGIEMCFLRQEVDCWRSEVARLRHMLADVRMALDGALGDGKDWPVPTEGISADVALLAARCKAAEAEVARLKGVTVLPGMPGAEL